MPPKEKGAANAAPPSDLAARFHGPLLVFFARRTGDHALAQDLTQETLLRVFAAQRLTHVEHPESYVFTVAMNLLRDRGEDAVVHFAVAEGRVTGVTMKALSPLADFSFDFQDLAFAPVRP